MNNFRINRRNLKVAFLLLVVLFAGLRVLQAEEGMWIPLLIEKYHIGAMQKAGLRLDAEDIYSINQECLKDAVVIFGRGCTGEVISGQGLVLTNHHCGEGVIQSHSSVEHDYLTDGYWAMSRDEELPAEGLSVTFLRYMKDVTGPVNEGLKGGMDPYERERRQELNRGEIIREATGGTCFEAEVSPFYYGNAYYLFVYEKFRDVRLVGAPPESIGNFGADTDNWVWPRHTGDFSLFRIYADRENQPADYSPANRPYRPRTHLEISTGGVREGDFTMVLGYPAATTLYLHSAAVEAMLETSLPLKIGLRTTRMEIMERYMKASDTVRIQYAHKYRRVSNAWKNWQGVILGLNRNHTLEKKREGERSFRDWVNGEGERQMKYDRLLDDFTLLYREMKPYSVAADMMREAIEPVELFRQSDQVLGMMQLGMPVAELEWQAEGFFRDFHMPVDREIFAAMMKAYHQGMPEEFYPAFFRDIDSRYRGDFDRFAAAVYGKAIFSQRERALGLLSLYEKKPEKAIRKLKGDPLTTCYHQFLELYDLRVNPEHARLMQDEAAHYKKYMAGLLEMTTGRLLSPDANRTMRLSWGQVEGYSPRDGVDYQYATTLSGLMEKNGEGYADYAVPAKLASLYQNRDYGSYGVNGTMPVCFIASNHTSGGNSGSPVLDAYGRLIGLNFDRDWEGTMSDIYYDPSLCRNIAVDIRYVLFIIDKFAGAGYLIEEMDLF
jgi:hypothetical protein